MKRWRPRRAPHRPRPPRPGPWPGFPASVNRQQGHLDVAEQNLRSVVSPAQTQEMLKRGFDFSRDYEVLNELGSTIFERAKQLRGPDRKTERKALLRAAAETFEKTLALDTENVAAHYNLQLIYTQLNEPERSAEHGRMRGTNSTTMPATAQSPWPGRSILPPTTRPKLW